MFVATRYDRRPTREMLNAMGPFPAVSPVEAAMNTLANPDRREFTIGMADGWHVTHRYDPEALGSLSCV